MRNVFQRPKRASFISTECLFVKETNIKDVSTP